MGGDICRQYEEKVCFWGQSTDICVSQVILMFRPWETAGPHGEHWADISVKLKGA